MDIDIVIIGLNTEATLESCIQSTLANGYTQGKVQIFYVDGGSQDRSLAIASEFPEVQIITLNCPYPTPGLGRNRGWQAGSAPLVQFLDSDTLLDPAWLENGVEEIQKPKVGAVFGMRKEIAPDASLFNWLGDLEWNGEAGEVEAFGGDVLLRREVLQESGGYDPTLIAGEDPEFSLRLRLSGWKIIHLHIEMTRHDLAMTSFEQYWRRAYRSGYAFTAVYALHAHESPFWRNEFRRILIRGGGSILLLLMGLFIYWPFSILSLILLLYPRLFRVKALKETKKLTLADAKIYAWHCSFVIIPQFFGLTRYYLGILFNRPLQNTAT